MRNLYREKVAAITVKCENVEPHYNCVLKIEKGKQANAIVIADNSRLCLFSIR